MGGGIEAVPGIELARTMGCFVVVSDMDPHAPGFSVAGDRVIASTYDTDATVDAAKKYHQRVGKIHGVMCIASDIPLTVATVAKALNLPGIPLESARLAMDKLAMKNKFLDDAVPVPWFTPVRDADHLKEIVRIHGFPLVLKPVDSRGARGVLQLNHALDLGGAFVLSQGESPTQRVMVERFLPGPQVSTESIVLDGIAYTPGFSDRNYEFLEKYAPHIIENGGELPSKLPQEQQESIKNLVQKAAASMGIANGVVKGDIVVSQGKPHVIELAARLSGGYFCSHEIPLNTGVDFVGCAIRMALGEAVEPWELSPRFQKGVAQRYLFPKPGKVLDISGVDQVRKRPEVEMCEVRVKPGDIISRMHSHPARAGVVITTGGTREEAVARAKAAVDAIAIETEPI